MAKLCAHLVRFCILDYKFCCSVFSPLRSIAAVASILWVVIAYFFTVVDSFTGQQ